MRQVTLLVVLAALAALAARPAGATWSIVAADAETQEVVVASATCLTGFDLKRYLPVIVVGKGGGAAQSYVDSTGQRRLIMWNGFQSGLTAQEIVAQLIALPSSALHQHGVSESTVATSATHTGASCGAYASGVVGSFGTVHYAIQGNVLTGQPAPPDGGAGGPEHAWRSRRRGSWPRCQAARAMGGDGRCSCSPGNPTGCGSPPVSFHQVGAHRVPAGVALRRHR